MVIQRIINRNPSFSSSSSVLGKKFLKYSASRGMSIVVGKATPNGTKSFLIQSNISLYHKLTKTQLLINPIAVNHPSVYSSLNTLHTKLAKHASSPTGRVASSAAHTTTTTTAPATSAVSHENIPPTPSTAAKSTGFTSTSREYKQYEHCVKHNRSNCLSVYYHNGISDDHEWHFTDLPKLLLNTHTTRDQLVLTATVAVSIYPDQDIEKQVERILSVCQVSHIDLLILEVRMCMCMYV